MSGRLVPFVREVSTSRPEQQRWPDQTSEPLETRVAHHWDRLGRRVYQLAAASKTGESWAAWLIEHIDRFLNSAEKSYPGNGGM
jgi:hypothetical protein